MYIYIYILQMILYFDSVYVAGGVMSFIASLMYLGLCSGFTETMMNDRMGKYLVTLQVLFYSCLCTHCNILQHSATPCKILQHCNTRTTLLCTQQISRHASGTILLQNVHTLQHAATPCNTLGCGWASPTP